MPRGRILLGAACGVALLISACRPKVARHPGPDAQGNAPGMAETIRRADEIRAEPYESVNHVYRNANSKIPSSVRLVVQDSLEWSRIWRRVVGPANTAPVPAIDFTREMLVVVGMGEHPCLGYGISVDTVLRDRERRVYAVVRERHRGARCGCLNEVISPIDIVKVPRTERPVTFLERQETNVCEER